MTYRIIIAERPYIQICRTLYELDEEFAFLLLGKRRGVNIKVDEILIPHQEVGAMSCKLLPKGYIEMNKITDKIVGWGHSHPDFGAFHSYTDETTGGGGSLFYTPFASVTTSRATCWDSRVFTENNGKKKDVSADLYLPQEVPLHKFKKIQMYEEGLLGRARDKIAGVLGKTHPPYYEDPIPYQNKAVSRRPTLDFCEGCVSLKKFTRRCYYDRQKEGVLISTLKDCPLDVATTVV